MVEKSAEQRFINRTEEIKSAIHARMILYEQVLWSGVGLFNAVDTVSRDVWAEYVKALRLNEHWPGIQGIGFSVPVPSEEKAAHIAHLRADGFPDYTIRPEGTRDTYSAIIYLEPFDWRNQRPFWGGYTVLFA